MCPSHQCGTLGKYLQWAWFLRLCWSYYSSCSVGRETLQRPDFYFIFSIMIIIYMPLWVQRLWNVKYTTRTVLRDFFYFLLLNNVKKEKKEKGIQDDDRTSMDLCIFYCISGLLLLQGLFAIQERKAFAYFFDRFFFNRIIAIFAFSVKHKNIHLWRIIQYFSSFKNDFFFFLLILSFCDMESWCKMFMKFYYYYYYHHNFRIQFIWIYCSQVILNGPVVYM